MRQTVAERRRYTDTATIAIMRTMIRVRGRQIDHPARRLVVAALKRLMAYGSKNSSPQFLH